MSFYTPCTVCTIVHLLANTRLRGRGPPQWYDSIKTLTLCPILTLRNFRYSDSIGQRIVILSWQIHAELIKIFKILNHKSCTCQMLLMNSYTYTHTRKLFRCPPLSALIRLDADIWTPSSLVARRGKFTYSSLVRTPTIPLAGIAAGSIQIVQRRIGEKNSQEPVFLKVYGARESIPRNEFRQPM